MSLRTACSPLSPAAASLRPCLVLKQMRWVGDSPCDGYEQCLCQCKGLTAGFTAPPSVAGAEIHRHLFKTGWAPAGDKWRPEQR